MWIDENVGLGLFILSIVIGYAFGALWGWGLFGLGLILIGLINIINRYLYCNRECECQNKENTDE